MDKTRTTVAEVEGRTTTAHDEDPIHVGQIQHGHSTDPSETSHPFNCGEHTREKPGPTPTKSVLAQENKRHAQQQRSANVPTWFI